jgi:PHP family Zn ribbon phosphoesterase
MTEYKADLHIHTVLSPCGSLEMSPKNILQHAEMRGLKIIGITDHNSTKHCKIIRYLAPKYGIHVLMGAEISTKEEVHCLVFFETEDQIDEFQLFIEPLIPNIKNRPESFGHQVVVDQDDNILEEIENLLISSLNLSIDQLEQIVHKMNGLFIPAHVNRQKFSLTSQLGFVPPDLKLEALELSKHITKEEFIRKNGYLKDYTFIRNSDAHDPASIGEVFSILNLEELSFSGIKKALKTNQIRF